MSGSGPGTPGEDGPPARNSLLDSILNHPFKVFLAGLSFIGLHYLASYGLTWSWAGFGQLINLIIKDAGIALVVAAGIAVAIEQRAEAARERLAREQAREQQQFLELATANVLNAYFEKELPDGWYDYMKDQIRESEILRTGLNPRVHLIHIGGQTADQEFARTHLFLEQTVKYRAKNISKAPARHRVMTYIEKPSTVDLPTDLAAENIVECLDFMVDDMDQLPDLDEADAAWENTKYLKKFSKVIVIPVGGEVEVYTRCRTVVHDRDRYVWASIYPALDMEINAIGCDGMQIHTFCLHPKTMSKDPISVDGNRIGSLTVSGPVLPGTSVEYHWHPVDLGAQAEGD